MMRMEEALGKKKLAAQMLLQVHDELVFEAPESEVARAMPVIAGVMEGAALPAVHLSVPLKVDAKAGDNWEAAH
jgi:DNA polymerase-1